MIHNGLPPLQSGPGCYFAWSGSAFSSARWAKVTIHCNPPAEGLFLGGAIGKIFLMVHGCFNSRACGQRLTDAGNETGIVSSLNFMVDFHDINESVDLVAF